MTRPDPSEPHELSRRSPFLATLGVTLVERSERQATIRMTVDDRHLRSRGIAHGGVIATLLDTAMGVAVSEHTPEGTFPVTAQLDTKFVRPAWDGEDVLATGEVCHRGTQTAVARGEVRTPDGVLVATGSGTFVFVVDPAPGEDRLPRRPD
jgi:acyl-CoA thioesterase